MKICKRCQVFGRVQGVFYRSTTRQKAYQLGLTGWARNLADGSVEVLACGEEASVDALRAWLWEGPAAADVTDVRCRRESLQHFSDFTTG
jgi:acylphosphatase